MSNKLPKAYEPNNYEDGIYKKWEESGFFNPDNLEGENFSVMMPPPNVTGVLHLGHALEQSLMDTFVRFKRMQGKKVLLLPGTDHAAVATQAKVEKVLVDQGIKNPREELGRDSLLEKVRQYSEDSKSIILNQIRKMGTSCDWSRLAYTFDEPRNKAVNRVFKTMYDDGLIYRGYRVVNWSVKGQSTCSDDELVHIDRKAKFYTFKYSADLPFSIATTRPETKLGDTAIAVNPNDKRYKKYIGQVFEIKNFAGGADLSLKVIADEAVDPEFGTGALGVTPAHSATDYEMYETQKASGNDIGLIQVIGEDGKMTDKAGENYQGLEVLAARAEVVKWLKENNLLDSEEEIDQSVGTSDRFGDVVEALPMTQWFVNVNKEIPGQGKNLKQLMKEAVEIGHKGDKAKKIDITPDRFEKIYYHWIDNLRDWCISRQIWWGHQIPVWYKGEEVFVGEEAPKGEGWKQDPDTLDTWFSSGLWTFSTLGWPEQTADFKTFHPSNWMQMGHEILFFWMARMIMMSTYILDEIPFKDVYIHGILRDKDGAKFSKTAGNGIDPIEVINKYGCDALRWSLMSGISPGNDAKFYEEKVEGSRNLVNKLWNISRFMLMSIERPNINIEKPSLESHEDKWIFNELQSTIKEVNNNIEKYNFSAAAEKLRNFTWDELADWYTEVAKVDGQKQELLNYILNYILKLWHPFVPFVTESIWQEIYPDCLLMVQKYPEKIETGLEEQNDIERSVAIFDKFKEVVAKIRLIKHESGVVKADKVTIVLDKLESIKDFDRHIKLMAGVKELVFTDTEPTDNTIKTLVTDVGMICLHLSAVDKQKEADRLKGEITELEKYVTVLDKKLSNKQFVDNAPEQVVKKEQEKLLEAQTKLDKLNEQLETLK